MHPGRLSAQARLILSALKDRGKALSVAELGQASGLEPDTARGEAAELVTAGAVVGCPQSHTYRITPEGRGMLAVAAATEEAPEGAGTRPRLDGSPEETRAVLEVTGGAREEAIADEGADLFPGANYPTEPEARLVVLASKVEKLVFAVLALAARAGMDITPVLREGPGGTTAPPSLERMHQPLTVAEAEATAAVTGGD